MYVFQKYYLILNIFLARAGSNFRVDACFFLAFKQSLRCGCVQFRGVGGYAKFPFDPPLIFIPIVCINAMMRNGNI